MKVLKPGRQQKGWATETECTGAGWHDGGCGALLLVEEADLFRSTQSQIGRDTCTYVLFECSECSVVTSLGNTDDIRVKLPRRFFHSLPTWEEWRGDQPA